MSSITSEVLIHLRETKLLDRASQLSEADWGKVAKAVGVPAREVLALRQEVLTATAAILETVEKNCRDLLESIRGDVSAATGVGAGVQALYLELQKRALDDEIEVDEEPEQLTSWMHPLIEEHLADQVHNEGFTFVEQGPDLSFADIKFYRQQLSNYKNSNYPVQLGDDTFFRIVKQTGASENLGAALDAVKERVRQRNIEHYEDILRTTTSAMLTHSTIHGLSYYPKKLLSYAAPKSIAVLMTKLFDIDPANPPGEISGRPANDMRVTALHLLQYGARDFYAGNGPYVLPDEVNAPHYFDVGAMLDTLNGKHGDNAAECMKKCVLGYYDDVSNSERLFKDMGRAYGFGERSDAAEILIGLRDCLADALSRDDQALAIRKWPIYASASDE